MVHGDSMLEIKNIEVFFIKVIQVLKGVSMMVPNGQIVVLLGANGGGKTTTLKAISGLLHTEEGEVTRGCIEYEGKRIDRMEPERLVSELRIIQVLEGRRVLEHLNVEENLLIGAYFRRDDLRDIKRDLNKVYGYFPRLTQLRNQISGYLSGGEQQMLVLGSAMMARPQLMLLDEPSIGLAPLVVKEIFNAINLLNLDEKISILLVEQNARVALSVAKYGYVMENGRIVLEGPSDELRQNEDIKEFYLGLSQLGKKSYRDVKHYRRRKRWLG